MKVKESILQEIDNYIDGRIDELSELAKEIRWDWQLRWNSESERDEESAEDDGETHQ